MCVGHLEHIPVTLRILIVWSTHFPTPKKFQWHLILIRKWNTVFLISNTIPSGMNIKNNSIAHNHVVRCSVAIVHLAIYGVTIFL